VEKHPYASVEFLFAHVSVNGVRFGSSGARRGKARVLTREVSDGRATVLDHHPGHRALRHRNGRILLGAAVRREMTMWFIESMLIAMCVISLIGWLLSVVYAPHGDDQGGL
jgi:hypothetical protein